MLDQPRGCLYYENQSTGTSTGVLENKETTA
jgi:hypothetical protein